MPNRQKARASSFYNSPEEMERKIQQYFNGGGDKHQMLSGKGKDKQVVEVAVPTITGLSLHLGFASRQSFYDYEKKQNYPYVIKKAKAMLERHYEQELQFGNTVGAIFALKNMGWSD